MTHIKITKGLDIPISGKPTGAVQDILPSGEAASHAKPRFIALNLTPFPDIQFKLLAKAEEPIKKGQPLVEDKGTPGRVFASPASGVIREVRRGLKRRLLYIVIELNNQEEEHEFPPLNIQTSGTEEIKQRLLEGGLFAHIRQRPFNSLADPSKTPRSIFVKAVESAPFVPPAEMQVEGYEQFFQAGLDALNKLTTGSVHLVCAKDSPIQAQNVERHTVEGPHPVSNASLHIQEIDPIEHVDDVIWTVTAHDVVTIGQLLTTGRYHTDLVVSIAGPGILPEQTGYFKARRGFPVSSLIAGRIDKKNNRFVSGDPLMGEQVQADEFLGFHHTAFTVIPENTKRELLHFFRLGSNKYTFSRAYLSGHFGKGEYNFTTNQHGEHRAFIDGTIYDKVQPLPVPTMQLVKAVMAEDYDLAEELGLLEVDGEDFALPSFVCPSKMEMTEIVKAGLKQHANDVLG